MRSDQCLGQLDHDSRSRRIPHGIPVARDVRSDDAQLVVDRRIPGNEMHVATDGLKQVEWSALGRVMAFIWLRTWRFRATDP
jgi:hypothetical protein